MAVKAMTHFIAEVDTFIGHHRLVISIALATAGLVAATVASAGLSMAQVLEAAKF